MELIAHKEGVDIIIAPVKGLDGVHATLDFNSPNIYFYNQDHQSREWDINLYDRRRVMGKAKFKAYQFLAEGVERRTISISQLELAPRYIGTSSSTQLAEKILDLVTKECDRSWGPVYGRPVLFIEKRELQHVSDHDRPGLFDFLKKVGEKILGIEQKNQPSPYHDAVVTVIGENLSLQLIQGHLIRSNVETC